MTTHQRRQLLSAAVRAAEQSHGQWTGSPVDEEEYGALIKAMKQALKEEFNSKYKIQLKKEEGALIQSMIRNYYPVTRRGRFKAKT